MGEILNLIESVSGGFSFLLSHIKAIGSKANQTLGLFGRNLFLSEKIVESPFMVVKTKPSGSIEVV